MNAPPPVLSVAVDYPKPKYTVEEVNRAARVIADLTIPSESDVVNSSFAVMDNWRAAHHFPLSTMYNTLRYRARKVYEHALTAQRIKRLSSIMQKLFDKKDMKLSQMQDIGGCRAVLPTIADVYQVKDIYLKRPLAHTLLGVKDYIEKPRETGYRSLHLKYRFKGSGSSIHWDKLKIEIQVRTQLQHQWATAVEAAGTFTKQALKSNQGSAGWLRFFALMGSVFALREGCAVVPETPNNLEALTEEVRVLNEKFDIHRTFSQFRKLIPHFEHGRHAKFYLVTLDPSKSEVEVIGFAENQVAQANNAYTFKEKSLPPDTTTQVVLVSVSSIASLKKAYPNYFLDTEDFLREVGRLLGIEEPS